MRAVARRIIGLTVVLTAGILAGAGIARAQAQDEPPTQEASCGPAYDHPPFALRGPSQIAVGRPWAVELLRTTGGSARITPDEGVRVTVQPTQPGARLVTQYVDRGPDGLGQWPLRLAPGDGPAQISATWLETRTEASYERPYFRDYQCTRTALLIARPIAGSDPAATHSVAYDLGLDDTVPRFTIAPPDNCAVAAVGRVMLTVSDGQRTRRLTLDDQCGSWRQGSVGTRDWSLVGRRAEGGSNHAYLRVRAHRNELRTFRYRVTFRGRTLDSGRLRARTDYYPERVIYDDEDDFVNVCLNDPNERIWKANGRLYCVVPTFTSHAYRFVE